LGRRGVYLGESLMEGRWTFGGRMARSPEVAVAMEREGREGRKKEKEEESIGRTIKYPKGASLDGALVRPKGASEGGTLLSTVARLGLPHLHPRALP
jgi:hypothetical protein